MGSSPGFASTTRDSSQRLAFAAISLHSLTSPRIVTRWLIPNAVTPQKVLRLLVGARFQALFHSPLGAFHLSLTVLVRYRSRESVQPWRVVPLLRAGFHCPALLWAGDPLPATFRVQGSHPVPPAFPGRSLMAGLPTAAEGCGPRLPPPNNTGAETPACTRAGWAARFHFAATPGISVDFSSSGCQMFQFPGCLAAYIFGGR